ncbi:hypothetical protein PF008_g22740 [Phytophthora fragariae]|uniref:RxLR effector protein n=1 Tax=Phytophthora fragariae TaxID=53985 RepID=A0A6G0QTH9_9STRA|nr:hypothetical protein PF008_g22740 [Phytophthora fragariae]
MRLQQALLVVVVSFLASTAPLPTATENEQARVSTLALTRSSRSIVGHDGGVFDDYVKEALKLNGLRGEALTKNKNYKAYLYFLKKSEEYMLNKWYRHEYSTYQGWKEHYVNNVDFYLFQALKAGYSPPAAMVARGASEAELTARTEIMAEAGRHSRRMKTSSTSNSFCRRRLR